MYLSGLSIVKIKAALEDDKIPEEIFSRVQEERSLRSNVAVSDDGVNHQKSTKYSAKKKK